ncbi:MAG: trimethylamine methyltransferase family protein [Candidatus Omnitrophota bacterium]
MEVFSNLNVLTSEEIDSIYGNAVRILSEIGFIVENKNLLELFASHGAVVSFTEEKVKFPRKFIETFLSEISPAYDEVEGLEVSCLLPYGRRREYSHGLEVTAGTYPQYYLTLEGEIVPHTQKTVSDMTRLADSMENIDRLGVMGTPSDVPSALGPLYMRLIAWKYAQNKLSGCGEVRNLELIPYVMEMGKIVSEAKNAPLKRYTFAEVELTSPLRFSRVESEIFVRFQEKGLLAGIGFMYSAGGSAPVTLAATVSLNLAESLFINFLYRFCYGLKKTWFQCNSSVLDMKNAMFPFGRPERGLIMLAMGQLARHFQAGLWASAVYPDAKSPGLEAGIQSAFNTIPAIMAGSAGIECFGLLSGAEINSPVQLVIDNEYAGALKRFSRGFAVNEETLAFDLIKKVGPGGFFTGEEHTVAHYRKEHWQPKIFSREGLNSWLKGNRKVEVDIARDICEQTLKEYYPQGINENTEKELLKVIDQAGKTLVK